MFRVRLRLLILYVAVITAILCVVISMKVNTYAELLHIGYGDIFASLPSEVISDGSITFLLLGIGGANHDGPTLTDSMTLVRYTPSTNTINTLGVPRDLWDPNIKDKVNSIYTYALQQRELDRFTYVKSKFSDLFNIQVDYIAVIDFNDFEELVDLVDGVDVTIDVGFVDSRYPKEGLENAECEPYDPNYGCRYETLVFRTGKQHLNGNVALKFVRSRHAQGDEGTDFSRSKRQQMVLTALRVKIDRMIHNREFDTLAQVLVFIDQKILRDIPNTESLVLSRMLLFERNKLKVGANSLDEEIFEVPPLEEYEGRYVLIPKDNDYENLQELISRRLNAQKHSDKNE